MINNLTLITGNEKKVIELGRNLGVTLNHEKLDLPEVQSLDIEVVVAEKAKAAFQIVQKPVLVEDTALTFHAMGRLPGTFIKWFIDELDYEGLCRLLDRHDDRSVTATACIGLYDGETLHTFVGESVGTVAEHPRPGDGFGWDCIFIPEGSERTWTEMSSAEKDAVSHRSRAVAQLKEFLAQN